MVWIDSGVEFSPVGRLFWRRFCCRIMTVYTETSFDWREAHVANWKVQIRKFLI